MKMKKEWDKRAEKNAYHYVSSFRQKWDDESFYRWGEIQTQAVIDRFLKDLDYDPSDKTILEIGCGAGRMTRTLASMFYCVHAYDVSKRYIQIAKEKNSHLKNVFLGSMMVNRLTGCKFSALYNALCGSPLFIGC